MGTWVGRGAGNGAVEEAMVWQESTQTYRLQLNPKIMLIESKYISQFHFFFHYSPIFSFP